MTATDELRRLLDERGVEWWEATPCKTKWNSPIIGGPVAAREWNGEMVLDTGYIAVTPAQAIAATLGTGTCHMEQTGHVKVAGVDYYDDDYECSECGAEIFEGYNFCPMCGRRIVEPTTNDVDAEVSYG